MLYARVIDGAVIETVELPFEVSPEQVYVPTVAAEFVAVTADVTAGWTYQDGEFLPPSEVVDLIAVKAALKASVDVAAEQQRLRYITPGTGQAMTYQQKMEEVRALAQDADPEPTNYPMLSAEIGITAPSLAEVAAVVLSSYQDWQHVGAAIEGVRLGAKMAIDAAETLATAQAAVEVSWPNT